MSPCVGVAESAGRFSSPGALSPGKMPTPANSKLVPAFPVWTKISQIVLSLPWLTILAMLPSNSTVRSEYSLANSSTLLSQSPAGSAKRAAKSLLLSTVRGASAVDAAGEDSADDGESDADGEA